jgi:hypothetical protein
MEFLEILKAKQMQLTELPHMGSNLRKQWEEHFVDHLHEKIKKSLRLYDKKNQQGIGFLWHVFSRGKKDCLERKSAEEAFNQEPKKECYFFFQSGDDAFIIDKAHQLVAKDLYPIPEVYIVDKYFKWTYVITDEFKMGPYFSRSHT